MTPEPQPEQAYQDALNKLRQSRKLYHEMCVILHSGKIAINDEDEPLRGMGRIQQLLEDVYEGSGVASHSSAPTTSAEQVQSDCKNRFVLPEKIFCNNPDTIFGNCPEMIKHDLCPRGIKEFWQRRKEP